MAFEAILARPDAKPAQWRRAMLTVSLVLHAVVVTALLIRSQWQVDEMPLPAIQVTLAEAPPPPPPPPPPAGGKKSASTKPKVPIKPQQLVQPKETPKEQPKPEPEEKEDNGQVGGVAGGVAGGVVGGVVGAPPPPPPKETGPDMLSSQDGRQQLLSNTSVPPYCCPKIPRALENVDQFVAKLLVCVTADGQVSDVRVVSGAAPAIDSQIPAFVRRWRYRPRIIGGLPHAFCYPVSYEISMR